MISLLWCACAFGEMHAIESVLPTFFGIPWHLGSLRYATPFTVAEAQSIPKTTISVNTAVVRCNKKAGFGRRPLAVTQETRPGS